MAEDFDVVGRLSFQMDDLQDSATTGRRRAFRTATAGVRVRVHGALDSFGVNDISAGGVCMVAPLGIFTKGEVLTLDILIADKRYLNNLPGIVVRVAEGESACAFQDLTRHQELKLDKLVLEMQKRYIAQRKLLREAEQAAQNKEDRLRAEEEKKEGSGPPVIHLR